MNRFTIGEEVICTDLDNEYGKKFIVVGFNNKNGHPGVIVQTESGEVVDFLYEYRFESKEVFHSPLFRAMREIE